MMSGELLFLSFAAIAAYMDIKDRRVPLLLFLTYGLAALFLCLAQGDLLSGLFGCVPGLILLLLSVLTSGAVGIGDGLFFMVSGLYLKASRNLVLLIASLFLGGIFSLAIFVYQRIKNNRYAGKDALPFLPFAAGAALFFFVMEL